MFMGFYIFCNKITKIKHLNKVLTILSQFIRWETHQGGPDIRTLKLASDSAINEKLKENFTFSAKWLNPSFVAPLTVVEA